MLYLALSVREFYPVPALRHTRVGDTKLSGGFVLFLQKKQQQWDNNNTTYLKGQVTKQKQKKLQCILIGPFMTCQGSTRTSW